MSEKYLIKQIKYTDYIRKRATKQLLIMHLKRDHFYHKLESTSVLDLMYNVSMYLPPYRNLAQPSAVFKLYCELLSYNRVWCIKRITTNTIYNIINTYHDINKADARDYLHMAQEEHNKEIKINEYKKHMLYQSMCFIFLISIRPFDTDIIVTIHLKTTCRIMILQRF